MSAIPLLVSLAVAYVASPALRRLAIAFNIVDHPSARKFQLTPVPLLGGVAVYLGVLLGLCFSPICDKSVALILLAATPIFIVSLVDDKTGLSARLRLLVQLTSAAILIFSGIKIDFLPSGLLGDAGEVLISFIWILGITNAFNYLDGLDGLCSGLAIIASFFFFVILYASGQKTYIFLPLSIIGACFGFLPHNFKKDKMFLGDAGSMFIGFIMSAIVLQCAWASDAVIKLAVPLLILGVPIFDMTFTTIMRYREKKIRTLVEWFEYAGRDHFHHYLVDLGLHPRGAVYFIYAVSISMGISAVIIMESDRPLYGLLTILKGGILFGLVSVLMVMGRRLHKESQVKDRMGI